MIDIIYKTVKPSHLKKIANHTKYKNANVPIIFMYLTEF